MKRLLYIATISVTLVFFVVNCDGSLVGSDNVTDPNNPSVQQVAENATKPEVQNLITGLELRNREYAGGLIPLLGSFGREVWRFDSIDGRFVTEWLGIDGDAETDPSFFGSAAAYDTPYSAILQANLILQSLENTDLLNEEEKNGVRGYAKTIQGYQFLIPLLTQYQNGIRVDVVDPQDLGPFESFEDALAHIRDLLDEGHQDLQNAGGSFFFDLSDGFADFEDPASMAQLNRAIAARAAVYAEDWQGALDALEDAEPFFELAEGEDVMNKGAYLSYGDPPDTFNPLFVPRNASADEIMVVHPSMIEDALDDDLRVERKFFLRDSPINNPNVPQEAEYQDNRYEGNGSPITMIRNEELILIYAEAQANLGGATAYSNAIDAINHVRNTWNLPDYGGAQDEESLIDEILFQRRYSLWAEFGHRWIDMRRYDRLDEIDQNDKLTGTIFQQMATPQSEINFENF